MVQETHLSNYHFDDIACFSLVGSCKLRKRSSNRLMAYCHEHQPGDTPPFREKRYQDSQDHSTKKETKQVDFGAADKIANDKRRGDNYSALKVKYMYYIDIRLRTSIAARGGGGSFKSEKIYESKEHVPIESFVTILID